MWLDFFKSKGHSVEQSASLVPQNDPTLLWTNAGVTPLKKYFDGSVIPANPRITNAQKCIRTNDIENVGKTARHHTFFEMLGNFSIGDYFRNEVLPWAYELLTDEKWFGIPKERLYITYYPTDKETFNLWVKCGIDPTHLVPLEGNFWEIGEGPCGPDTEIFYDRGDAYDKRGVELLQNDIENDRFIEIWNIVFSQFNSKPGVPRKEYKELPHKNIDTGSGLERLCCIMQEVNTNYDTDLFKPLIDKIEEISGVKYEGQMAFKVIADHVRTVTFAVADGATMSNEGRGYVLRRVLRRATKYAKRLGINKPFMASLVDVVVSIMNPYYTYLNEKSDIVKEIITREETKFLETISLGEKRFAEIAQKGDVISGEDAFLLYDTYGFPYELTVEYAAEQGKTVDEEGFKRAMDEQKERARSSRKDVASMKGQNEAYMEFKEKSEFVGYTTTKQTAKVIGVFDDSIVLDKTPFYAFSGGQLSDKGTIDGHNVLDVIKMPNGQHLHKVENNTFKVGDTVCAMVDEANRNLTRKNHSSAHLFQSALQHIFDKNVHQQGSQVSADYMRFDFNNYSALTDEQILNVETLVNEFIKESHEVITHVLPLEEAKKLDAMALFDEKYGDLVRVVDMGVSREFCAGTHVSNTSEIEKFEIVSVESIGSGIYRCLATTGPNAFDKLKSYLGNLFNELATLKQKAASIVESAKQEGIELSYHDNYQETKEEGYSYVLDLHEHIAYVAEMVKILDKQYQQKKSQNALSNLDAYQDQIENNNLFITLGEMETNILKDLASALANKYKTKVVFITSLGDDKVSFVCKTDGTVNASDLVKKAALICDGRGGGKPDLAQAGGKNVEKVNDAIAAVKESL